ncbi:amidase [Streptomyces sp. NPDC051684]|uniref:amidase n=1 Tax=Streptomyces sp. NPDC051684 TaxID=3365670 RepID=UPI0037BD2799
MLDAVRAANPRLRAFVEVAHGTALDEARAADRLLAARGEAAFAGRPLLGVTVSVKDLIQTEQLPTRRGSLLPNRRAAVDAPSVARLRAAGAVVIGKTATSEYGWSASTVGRTGAATRNPWSAEHSAGGSSGGSAAAVAAGLGTASLGTDGAGSVRIPAAFCGVVGLKPSFGQIPYVPPCPERLSHVGPLTRCVADARALFRVMAGPDPRDPQSVPVPADTPSYGAPPRIGWIEFAGTSAPVRGVTEEALAVLADLGQHVDRIESPFTDPYEALVDVLAAAEAHGTAIEDEPWCDEGRLALVRYGRALSAAAVARAEQTRLALRTRLGELMRSYDLLAMATVPVEPFAADAIAPDWAADPEGLRWLAWSPATYPFNLTGQPALSLPVGRTPQGLPVGLQLVGRTGEDLRVLATAERLESALGPMPAPPAPTAKGS